MSAAARATNFCRTESPLGTYTGPEGCLHRSQASHLSRRSSADQSSKSGEMGEVETARLINFRTKYLPSLRGHSDFF